MAWFVGLVLLLGSPAVADEIRGVAVSCPTWGWEWGSDAMVDTLDELDDLGVTWVQIHPYAGIRGDGSLRYRAFDPDDPPDWIVRPVREAHARGQKVLIKPHLAYWGSPFSWRGEIAFDDPVARTRFFADYQAWITLLAQASATAGADGFAVGTELDGTTRHEGPWRAVIASVRSVYPGPLTYAANWDAYQRVPFWDAVDVIGIQAYFPLSETSDRRAIDDGWTRIMGDIASFSQHHDRHVVFTELGYPRSPHAAARPWEARDHADHSALQATCIDAALDAIEAEPRVIGAFLWKWFPGNRMPRDFAIQRPEARRVLSEHWTTGSTSP